LIIQTRKKLFSSSNIKKKDEIAIQRTVAIETNVRVIRGIGEKNIDME
jgi:hypothetical protein